VLERGFEQRAVPAPEVGEVGVRHHGAGDVLLAFEAEQRQLDVAQRAVLQALAEQRPRQLQEVDVLGVLEVAGHARHHPAGAQQGQVEGGPVVGAERGGLPQLLLEGVQEGGLPGRLGQEELDHLESRRHRPCQRGGEGVGAGAAAETRGLGVEIGVGDGGRPALDATDRPDLGPAPGAAEGRGTGLEALGHRPLDRGRTAGGSRRRSGERG